MVDHIRRCSSFSKIGVNGKYLLYVSVIEHDDDAHFSIIVKKVEHI